MSQKMKLHAARPHSAPNFLSADLNKYSASPSWICQPLRLRAPVAPWSDSRELSRLRSRRHARTAEFSLRGAEWFAAAFAGRSVHRQYVVIDSVGICFVDACDALVLAQHRAESAFSDVALGAELRSAETRCYRHQQRSQVPGRSTARQPRVNANGNGPGSLVRYAPSKKTRARSPMASSN